MLTLVNRLKQCLSEFSSVRLLFLPLSIQFSLKGSREAQPTPEGLGITLHILEGEPKLFGIFTYEKFSSSPPLIYYLFISVWANEYFIGICFHCDGN